MEIGIGLPNAVRGIDRAGIVDWAQRADRRRLLDARHDRSPRLPGLRVADRAGGGRGGHRADPADHRHPPRAAALRTRLCSRSRPRRSTTSRADGWCSGSAWACATRRLRGSRAWTSTAAAGLRAQLAGSCGFWAGEGGVGPEPPTAPAGPPDRRRRDAAYRRAAEYADGWTMAAGPRTSSPGAIDKLRDGLGAAGREDEPRKVALCYFCLGDDAEARRREPRPLLRVARRVRQERGRGGRQGPGVRQRATWPPSSRRAPTRSSASRLPRPGAGRAAGERRGPRLAVTAGRGHLVSGVDPQREETS